MDWILMQDTLFAAVKQPGRDLRRCDQTEENTITCQDTFLLSTGEDCTVTATCPLQSDSVMADCFCSVEINGLQCRECKYCEENNVSIDCKGIYSDSGCFGIDCNGECVDDPTFTWEPKATSRPTITEAGEKDLIGAKEKIDDKNESISVESQIEDKNSVTSSSYPDEDSRNDSKSNAHEIFLVGRVSTVFAGIFTIVLSL